MSTRVSVLLAVVAGVLAGALVAGSALTGASASPRAATATSSAAAGSGSDHPKGCGWRFKRLPTELRADLKAARALPVGERRAAVRKIVEAARAGEYGARVETLVKHRAELRKRVRALLPSDLRADLRALRHLPTDERRAARKEIRKDALAGEYGAQVQRIAERLRAHRAQCRAAAHGTA